MVNNKVFDPPGHGRVGGYYFHVWSPFKDKIRTTKDAICEDTEHFLDVALRVIFKFAKLVNFMDVN